MFHLIYSVVFFIGGIFIAQAWLQSKGIDTSRITDSLFKYKEQVGLLIFIDGAFSILTGIFKISHFSGDPIELIFILAPYLIFACGFLMSYDYMNKIAYRRKPELEVYAHKLRVFLYPYQQLLGLALILYSFIKLATLFI